MGPKSVGHYVLGTEGLALLRTSFVADEETLLRRVDELAALAATIAASGAAALETVELLTPQEVDAAAKKTVTYRPPGA